MSDMNLLLFGVVVFGLMLIGVVLTVVEFRRLTNDEKFLSLCKNQGISIVPCQKAKTIFCPSLINVSVFSAFLIFSFTVLQRTLTAP